jgi:UDP-N-acetylmuramyl tripeptide synthase
VDGHKYLAKAVAQGAVAALVEDVPAEVPQGCTLLKVADTRKAMEIITPYFYDYPGRTMR